jgi:hypothetical protein
MPSEAFRGSSVSFTRLGRGIGQVDQAKQFTPAEPLGAGTHTDLCDDFASHASTAGVAQNSFHE